VVLTASAALLAACGGANNSGANTAINPAVGPSGHLSPASRRALTIEGTAVRASTTPSRGTRQTVFAVSFVARERTGRLGKARRSYEVTLDGPPSHAVPNPDGPGWVGCVTDNGLVELPLDHARPGQMQREELDPARSEDTGGWCAGRYHGQIDLRVGYACPAAGPCHPDRFPTVVKPVGQFSFSVRRVPTLTAGQGPAINRIAGTGGLRRCPPAKPGSHGAVGGDWSARVHAIGCRTVGRFIFDRFLGDGVQAQLSTTRDQGVVLGNVKCAVHPQPAGWRVSCRRGAQRFVFVLRP
jgi:hypothetical protein